MGMYENLNRLEMTDDIEVPTPDLDRWCGSVARQLAVDLEKEAGEVMDSSHVGAGISLGFQYGLAYAREFGLPDFGKTLVVLAEPA